ncbi:ATP-dependent DNA ligase [candidate division WWE3 bacterium]|nr:ATP-dependent DNA ligase [candidate division WWE3 bacterium]
MKFSTFAEYLDSLDKITSRNDMVIILANLLRECHSEEIDKVVYLALGRLGPLYNQLDLGISSKLMLRVLSVASETTVSDVEKLAKKLGDLGDVTNQLLKENINTQESLTVADVYSRLENISRISGKGSQEEKINEFAELLHLVSPISAKYIVRIPLNKLRLGFSDMTILDALSWMIVGDKGLRKQLEQSYNISADIGGIASTVCRSVNELVSININVGVPIRPAAAERLPSAAAIIEKLGRVAAEPKLDGFRLQCHYDRSKNIVQMFSRNLEPMTEMFPEVKEALERLPVDSIILEGEAVAYNPETEEYLPFQETVQRRRKHNIESIAKEIPLRVFCFDLLYLNGKSYIDVPYEKRRTDLLTSIGKDDPVIRITEEQLFDNPTQLSSFFIEQIEHGLEGIMVKRLDAGYAAGSRNYNWVKLKREERAVLSDSIDCVVMGYVLGKGKRTQFGIGAFLVGVYDEAEDVFTTITKVGTGLTDEQWKEMKLRADQLKVDTKPARYIVPAALEQDVWIKPGMVVEIRADEITRSPVHTTGVTEGIGYALRFPRLLKWRDDKNPEQATSVAEIINLYQNS